MKFGKSHLLAAASAASLLSFGVQAQQELRITACSSSAPVMPFVRFLSQTFIPAVNAELAKESKLKIVWNEAYGGTLAKVGGELEAVQQGVCDMGTVGTVFHAAKLPLQQVSYVTPFGPTDFKSVIKVMNTLNHEQPAMVQAWHRNNQVFLTYFAVDDYALFSNFPVTRYEDLNGKKVASAPLPLSWLKNTGAVGVVSGIPSYYNDIKSGVYEGVLTWLTAATPIKLYEVAPYLVRAGLGATAPGALTVNKNVWDRLGPDGQRAFRVAAEAYIADYIKHTETAVASAEATLVAGGGKVTPLGQEERQRWANVMANPATPWIKQNGEAAREVLNAYMAGLKAEGVTFLRDWSKE